MLNDTSVLCELVGEMMRFSFECEFDWVERGETFIQRLLEREYDLIFLDSVFPEVAYAELPADLAAMYRAIPKERRFTVGVKRWTEGERLFRLLRSPEARDLGWATDVASVPVIFLTGGPGTLNRAIIRTMPPVAILDLSAGFQEIVRAVEGLLGLLESGE